MGATKDIGHRFSAKKGSAGIGFCFFLAFLRLNCYFYLFLQSSPISLKGNFSMQSKGTIHPTAIIDKTAQIASDVTIGPYSIVGPHVTIGSGAAIGPHVVLDGHTVIGEGVNIFQFSSIGAAPQDLKYQNEPTRVEIGNNTIIREFVTIHRGTAHGRGVTKIGHDCMLMAYCHIAHDCEVGNRVIMANGATLGGHVSLGNNVVIGGLTAIHQFCRVGDFAFLGGMSGVDKDIPPYVKYWGARGKIYGLNVVGLRRNGFAREVIGAVKTAYRIVFHRLLDEGVTIASAVQEAREKTGHVPEVQLFLDFIASSQRGVPLARQEEEAEE
jgi:UDP-N-acetylglucosamine acyltransferase